MPSFKDRFIKRLYPLINLDPFIKNIYSNYQEYNKNYNEILFKVKQDRFSIENMDINVMKKLRHNICEIIYKTGACVSGSFLLDCLYDTNYHNDIDIYDIALTSKWYKKELNRYNKNPARYNHYTAIDLEFLRWPIGGAFTYNIPTLLFSQFLYLSGFKCIDKVEGQDGIVGSNIVREYIPREIDDLCKKNVVVDFRNVNNLINIKYKLYL